MDGAGLQFMVSLQAVGVGVVTVGIGVGVADTGCGVQFANDTLIKGSPICVSIKAPFSGGIRAIV